MLKNDGYSLSSETQYDHIVSSIQIDIIYYVIYMYWKHVSKNKHNHRHQTLLKIIATAATVHINFD